MRYQIIDSQFGQNDRIEELYQIAVGFIATTGLNVASEVASSILVDAELVGHEILHSSFV
jgi:hypothetical protein